MSKHHASSHPYWFNLIDYWVNVRKRTGLTLPFIIGVPHIVGFDGLKSYSVAHLIEEIASGAANQIFKIQYCGDIMEYVVGLHSSDLQIATKITSPSTNRLTLVTTLNAETLGKDLREIMTSLEFRYLDCINNRRFSRSNLKWNEYSPEDVYLIGDALQSQPQKINNDSRG